MMKTEDLYTKSEECCGCSLCANACPVGIIQMQPDESGFLYPSIKEISKCINCHICLQLCPLKNVDNTKSEFVEFYAGSFVDDKETITCASGGIATALSQGFVRNDGIVYGAAYSADWKKIEYVRADSLDMIEYLKSSKYAQADKGSVYNLIKDDLKKGLSVLFIGLPCDVAAVKYYLGKFANLYTVELICHGPTSPKVHMQYCEELEKRFGAQIDYFSTRYKRNGRWKPFYIKAKMKNGKDYEIQFHNSSYGAAFRYLKRPSCYVCPVKENSFKGDIMIGDYHYVEEGMKAYNPHGVSSILIHSEKGKKLLSYLDDSFSITSIDKRGALANGAIHYPIKAPKSRMHFANVFIRYGLRSANKLIVVKLSNIERKVKAIILKCGVKIKRIIIPSSKPQNKWR